MKKYLLGLIALLAIFPAKSQVLSPLETQALMGVRALYADTATHTLLVGGNFFLHAGRDTMGHTRFWRWGEGWRDTDPTLIGHPEVYLQHNGTIWAGGSFSQQKAPGQWAYGMLQVWDEESWTFVDSTDGSVFDLRIHQGSLYAFGRFDSIGGIAARMVARWDGTRWDTVTTPFPLALTWLTGGLSARISCGIFYQDKLYVGGNFTAAGRNDLNDIACWEPDSGRWTSVGGGFSGPWTWVQDMIVYDSLLVVAGYFSASTGDPGEGVAAWDGQRWIPMGSGLDNNVQKLHIHEGELYAAGAFTLRPNGPYEVLARWTGTTWEAALPGLEGYGLGALATMDGQLYMGGGFMFFGEYEYINIASYGPLGVSIAAPPPPLGTPPYPNPTPGRIAWDFDTPYTGTVTVWTLAGQQLRTIPVSGTTVEIDLKPYPPGLYLLRRDDGQVAKVRRE